MVKLSRTSLFFGRLASAVAGACDAATGGWGDTSADAPEAGVGGAGARRAFFAGAFLVDGAFLADGDLSAPRDVDLAVAMASPGVLQQTV
jgi:hypothetical protein